MLSNLQLSFVPYTRDFLSKSWNWLNDAETKALTLTPDFTQEQQELFYESLPFRTDYLIFGVALAGEPIGACGLKHITPNEAEYWGYIGEKQYWGRGLGRQIIEHCGNVAREKGLKSLYLYVGDENIRAKKLYERCGFVKCDSVQGSAIMMRKNI